MAAPRISPKPNCALQYHPDGYRADRVQIKGRHSAGAGFLKGFIDHGGVDRLIAMTPSKAHFQDFHELTRALGETQRRSVWARPLDTRALRQAGTIFLPGPGFEKEAWNRRLGSERDFSLCGITHTVASELVVNVLGRYLIAPTQPWDALICTSSAVRQVVERIIGQHADYLERRGGGRFQSPVRLPVIPLGVDCDFYRPDAASGGLRAGLRQRLGIADDDVAGLFLGRLSFHAKAHPTPMFIAAERAAARTPGKILHLLIVGQFPNPWIETEFREAAARFCQRVRVHFLDGADHDLVHSAWRASDYFISLSDNIQESFGLTPIEAMAAGLPCVVTDWNGYKDTITDGEVGFRIPTLTARPGEGLDIADRYAAGADTYDRFIGVASLSTVADIDACADAIAALANDPELRARQGAAGIERARRLYDWRVVIGAYQSLWAELAEIRRGGAGLALRDHAREPAQADYPDPFDMFQDHPSGLIGADTVVAVKSPDITGDLATIRQGELHTFVASAFLSDQATDETIGQLAARPTRVGDLPAYRNDRRKLIRTLLWLAKFDLVEFS